MSNVPKAREEIDAIAEALLDLAARLDRVQGNLHRRPYARARAPRAAPPVNAGMAEFLREFARKNPNLSQREIGQRFGIDGGRVSEALHGDR